MSKVRRKLMEMVRFFQLWFHCTCDSHFILSHCHKCSYDSTYDSNSDPTSMWIKWEEAYSRGRHINLIIQESQVHFLLIKPQLDCQTKSRQHISKLTMFIVKLLSTTNWNNFYYSPCVVHLLLIGNLLKKKRTTMSTNNNIYYFYLW